MRVLVTGGAGFIGCQVVRRLLEQPTVEAVINLDALTYAGHLENVAGLEADPRYRFEQVDLRERAAVRRAFGAHAITCVLHLAAESHVDRSIAAPADFVQTNVVGTYHLLEAAREAWSGPGPRRCFVQVSTDEVYGSAGADEFFSEASPYAPNSPYAATKAAGDFLARSYHQTYGLPVIITHCTNNYGPRQHPEKLIPTVIQSLIERRPVPVYGDGGYERDWLHVLDHAEALWRVVADGVAGAVYDIGGGEPWPNLRLIERLCELFDELTGATAGPFRERVAFVADRPGHDRRYAMRASRMTAELGWRPSRDFESGLRETVRWYGQNQGWVQRVLAKSPRAPRPAGERPVRVER